MLNIAYCNPVIIQDLFRCTPAVAGDIESNTWIVADLVNAPRRYRKFAIRN
jgi:hypothetical protein